MAKESDICGKFGKLKYVHVAITTYSRFLMATAQTGEATKQVITKNCLPSI